jgi:hypothetical protein
MALSVSDPRAWSPQFALLLDPEIDRTHCPAWSEFVPSGCKALNHTQPTNDMPWTLVISLRGDPAPKSATSGYAQSNETITLVV